MKQSTLNVMMKKNKKYFLTFILIISCYAIQAQQGDSYINLQAGIKGSIQATNVKTPSFYGSYEYFVRDNISIGVIGGYAPLSLETLQYVNGQGLQQGEEEISNIVGGGLLNFYLANGDEFDFYLGGSIGYASGLTARFLYEMHAGARYNLSDSFALNSEVGYGLSLLKVGISFKL
ncbi:conserved protein of unknown function [Tenacibaculum sp. 190524A02b]|uniref:hypothetical protein n=1 Tax=Tenacibaculum vairaonense TaxID=3137860 RepID=UPI0032B20CA7